MESYFWIFVKFWSSERNTENTIYLMKKVFISKKIQATIRTIVPTFLNHFSLTKAVAWGCSARKIFLDILQNLQENTCVRVSFLINLEAEAYNLIKKRLLPLAQVFSCEFSKVSKNTFSSRTPPVAFSVLSLNRKKVW